MSDAVRALGVAHEGLLVREAAGTIAAADGSGWSRDPTAGMALRTMSIGVVRSGVTVELFEATATASAAGTSPQGDDIGPLRH